MQTQTQIDLYKLEQQRQSNHETKNMQTKLRMSGILKICTPEGHVALVEAGSTLKTGDWVTTQHISTDVKTPKLKHFKTFKK